MTVSHTPAPARSDVVAPSTRPSATPVPSTPATGRVARLLPADRPYRRHGLTLTAGAAAWSAGTAIAGVDPVGDQLDLLLAYGGAAAFQVGLLALLRALWLSRALGTGRLARFFLRLETGLVTLAICSTVADGAGVSDLSEPAWALLDAFWPLSMLGMFAIGIRIAIAGRWTGTSRFWPMVAESWAVVVIPTMMLFGYGVATVVACVHLLVGYCVLGVLVARKER